MQTPSSPAPLMPPVRKIGPASDQYDRHVVSVARELTMDTRGHMVERVVSTLGPRRSVHQDEHMGGSQHRTLVQVQ